MTGSYFDPYSGHVVPTDDYESDTQRGLKKVTAELKRAGGGEKSSCSDLYDAVERLLYTRRIFVRQGVRETMGKGKKHKNVSWYLTERDDGRALINYQDGVRAEWCNDCYADEVPLWLLIGLFRRIQRRKPLGDQKADETIARVGATDREYVNAKEMQELQKQLGFGRDFHSSSSAGDSDDGGRS
jgi:hypothetical protein